jgi:hypothetical protein
VEGSAVTATTAYPQSTAHGFGTRHLILTALLGAAIGSGATLLALRPDVAAAPVAPATSTSGASTTASEQYRAWYTRPSSGAIAAPGPGSVPDARGTTTAGEQYLGWYLRGTTDRSGWMSIADYYRSWFLRDAGDQ